jgi:Na+-translocating ferredoxin:NAD+ oxidoreductase RNF subunit RnfB
MLTYFEEEFRQHVIEKRCPAKECKALWEPQIDPALCRGCGVCIRKCPVEAISGERKQLHYINESLCIKCGACVDACRLKAIA